MKSFWVITTLLIGTQVSIFADTIMPGTQIPVRTDGPITVARWDRGRIYSGHVSQDVYARDGDIAIRRGAQAELIVRQVGPDQLALDLESVTVNGTRYALDIRGPQYNMPQNAYNDGSGVLGSIIGAIAGANGEQVETRGREIRIPVNSVVTFQLQQPLRVVTWNDPGYDNGGYHYHREHDWYR